MLNVILDHEFSMRSQLFPATIMILTWLQQQYISLHTHRLSTVQCESAAAYGEVFALKWLQITHFDDHVDSTGSLWTEDYSDSTI